VFDYEESPSEESDEFDFEELDEDIDDNYEMPEESRISRTLTD